MLIRVFVCGILRRPMLLHSELRVDGCLRGHASSSKTALHPVANA